MSPPSESAFPVHGRAESAPRNEQTLARQSPDRLTRHAKRGAAQACNFPYGWDCLSVRQGAGGNGGADSVGKLVCETGFGSVVKGEDVRVHGCDYSKIKCTLCT